MSMSDDAVAKLKRGFTSFPSEVAGEPAKDKECKPAPIVKRRRYEDNVHVTRDGALFVVDTRGQPRVKDGHGCIKPEAFPEIRTPAGSFLVGGREEVLLGGAPSRGTFRSRHAASRNFISSHWELLPCELAMGSSFARNSSPPGRRYFLKKESRGRSRVAQTQVCDVLFSSSEVLAAEAKLEDRAAVADGALAAAGFVPPLYLPLRTFRLTPDAHRGAALRQSRQESLSSCCRSRGGKADSAAWLAYAELQWDCLGEAVGAQAWQVREKQFSILEAALRECPGDARLLRAMANVEAEGIVLRHASAVDTAVVLSARWSRLVDCEQVDVVEDLVWNYLEAAIVHTDQETAGRTVYRAVEDTLRVLAARKFAAGHDGKAVVALERAELAAISALALAESMSGRFGHALAVLRANATLGVFFPGSNATEAALEEAWVQDIRLGGACAIHILQGVRLLHATAQNNISQTHLAILADLVETMDPAAVSVSSTFEYAPGATELASLLCREDGRMGRWVAKELQQMLNHVAADVPFREIRPFLVTFRTDIARKEALMRFLDLLGAPTLGRHAPNSKYRRMFADTFAPLALKACCTWKLGRVATTHGSALPKFQGRPLLLARTAVHGLAVWPGDIGLLEALIQALWYCDKGGGKLPRRVLQVSEDPRLFFVYAQGLWCRGHRDAARTILLKLCATPSPIDARIAMGWWRLELFGADTQQTHQQQPPRAIRVVWALAFRVFDPAQVLNSEPVGADHGLHSLQAAARLRRQLAEGSLALSHVDAAGSRFLVSTYHSIFLALCSLEAQRSPQRVFELLVEAWSHGNGGPSSVASVEEQRCWEVTVGMIVYLLLRAGTSAPTSVVRKTIQLAMERLPVASSPWFLRAVAAAHLQRSTVSGMRRDLDRYLGIHSPPPLDRDTARCSVLSLRVALEAEIATPSCSVKRLVALCEKAQAHLCASPFSGAAVCALLQASLLRVCSCSNGLLPAMDRTTLREERWRVAVRSVSRYANSKVLWLLQLAAWEARSERRDEEELVDMLESMDARGILLGSDPLEAVA